MIDALLEVGFSRVGGWRADGGTLVLALSNMEDAQPALYAFVVDGRVMYVGKTAQTLRRRLYGYLKGSRTQRTNIRVREEIERTLAAHKSVEIYALEAPSSPARGRFQVNMAAGLEDDIIKQLCPLWNVGGRTATESGPAEHQYAAEKIDVLELGQFTVRVGKAYYRQGFFNVPVASAGLFGGDGEHVTILIGANQERIVARINRSANLTGAPRIMGGTLLRNWIQDNVGLGGLLHVTVTGKGQLNLVKKG